MFLSNNLIDTYSKYVEFENENEKIEEFVNLLDYGMSLIREHLNMDFEYQIEPFGSIDFSTVISQYEPISFAIKINDAQIYENVVKCAETKGKNKKAKLITTESIKLLLSIFIEKYFEDIGNVSFLRTCLLINAQSLFGFNAKVYVFASMPTQNISLEINSSRTFNVNFEQLYENFSQKATETNYNYVKVVNIIKNLCEKSNLFQNPLLVETLIYNVPNSYLQGDDLRGQVVKSLNFVKLSNLSKFKSLVNPNITLDKDYFTLQSIYGIYKELESLSKLLQSYN